MKRRRFWWGLAGGWCLLIFALSSIPDQRTGGAPMTETMSRKGAHLVEYGVLAYLVLMGYRTAGALSRGVLAKTLLFCFLFAASDEFHQSFVPGRYGKVRDVALDTLGAALVVSWMSRRRENP